MHSPIIKKNKTCAACGYRVRTRGTRVNDVASYTRNRAFLAVKMFTFGLFLTFVSCYYGLRKI